MNDEQIDRLLARPPAEIPPNLADTIRARLRSDARPVKPLPSPWLDALVFILLFALIGIAFAAKFGFDGWRAQTPLQSVLFLASLCLLALAAAAMMALALRPGSGRLYSGLLCTISFAAYEALVLALYRNYSTTGFVHLGLVCLSLGVLCGVLTAVPVWFMVRRGFVVYPKLAGALLGLVGGLTGLLALTLLCPLLTTPHAAVWHAAVVPVCVAIGSLAGRFLVRR